MLLTGVIGVALLVLVGGAGFFVGRATAPEMASHRGTPAFGNGNRGPNGGPTGPNGGGFGNGFGNRGGQFPGGQFPGGQVPGGGNDGNSGQFQGLPGRPIAGTVQAVDATSLTVKLTNGSSLTIARDANTTYRGQTNASASDVVVGAHVSVRVAGQPGSGSGLTARSITILP